MRINLDESEIVQALREFIETQGIPLSGKEVTVHLTAGRGANGHKAQVDIVKPTCEVVREEATEASEEEQPAILFGDEED